MFKKLKQKIVEEVENSPLRPSVMNTSTSSLNSVGRLGSSQLDISETNTGNLVDISEDNVVNTNAALDNFGAPSRSSSAMEGSFLGGGSGNFGGVEDPSFSTPFSTPMSVGVGVSRSRRSSSSSILSDISATPAILQPSPSSPVKFGIGSSLSSSLNNGAGFLSNNSAANMSDNDSGVCPNLETLSREQLVFYFRRTEQNMLRYKAKLKEVSLSSHQEKFVRHMGEIKEQLILEQKAKKHLEENFTMTLDEKEEQIKVLQTQIMLLKEAPLSSTVDATPEVPTPPSAPSEEQEALVKDNAELKQRINQLENLLMKCKENIKTNKDKVGELTKENESLKAAAAEESELIESLRKELDEKLSVASQEAIEELRVKQQKLVAKLTEVEERSQEDREQAKKELEEERARLLATAGEENARLLEKYEAAEALVEDLREAEEKRKREIREAESEGIKSSSQEIASLMDQMSTLVSEKDAKERMNVALKDEVVKLKIFKEECAKRDEDMELLIEKLEEVSRKKGELEEAGKSSQDRLGEVWTSLNSIKQERDQFQNQLEETVKIKEEADTKWGHVLEETENSLKCKLNEVENKAISLKGKVDAKDAELTSKQSIYEKLKSNYEVTQRQKDEESFGFSQRETTLLNQSASLKDRINELQASLSEKHGKENEAVKLQAVVTELEGKVTSLESSLASVSAELDRKNTDISVLNEKLIAAYKEVKNLRDDNHHAEEVSSGLKAEMKILDEKLAVAIESDSKLKNENDANKKTANDLQAKMEVLSGELNKATCDIEGNVKNLNLEKAQKDEIRQKLVVSEELIGTLQVQLDEKNASLVAVEERLRDAENVLSGFKEKSVNKFQDMMKKVDELQQRLEDALKKITRLDQVNSDNKNEINQLGANLEQQTQELIQQEEVNKGLQDEINASSQREIEMSEKCDSLTKDVSKIREEREEAESRLSEKIRLLKSEGDGLSSQIEEVTKQLESAIADHSAERLKTQSLSSECEVLKVRLEKNGKGNEELNNLLQERQAEMDQLRAEAEELRPMVKKAEADLEKAKKAFETLKTQAKTRIADIQEKLKQKGNELEAEKAGAIEKILEKSKEVEELKTSAENLFKRLEEVTADATFKNEEYQSKVQQLTTEFEKTLLQFSTEHDGLIQQREGEKAALSDELASLKEEKAQTASEHVVVQQKLTEMEHSHTKLIAEMENYKAEIQRSLDSHKTHQKDLDASKDIFTQKEEEIERSNVVVESLKSELDSSRSELSTQLGQDEELQRRLQELTEKLTSTESKLQDLTDTYENKLSEYQTALNDARKEKVASHEEKIAEKERHHAEELESYSSQLDTLIEKRTAESEVARDRKKQLEEREEMIKEKEAIENGMRQEAKKLTKDIASLKEKLEDAQSQLQLRMEEFEAKSKELKKSQNQVEEMKIRQNMSEEAIMTREAEQIVSLNTAMDSLKTDLKSTEAERSRLKAAKDVVDERLDTLQAKQNSVDERLQALQSEKDAVDEQLKALQSELSSAKVESQTLEAERETHLNRMDAERRDWEKTKNESQMAINSHLETISGLKSARERLESTLESETRISAERQLEIESLVVEKMSLDAELQRTKGEIGDRLKKVRAEAEDRKNESVAETMIQFNALSESVGMLEAEIERLKSENEELTSKSGSVEGIEAEMDKLRLENESLKEESKAVEGVVDIVRSLADSDAAAADPAGEDTNNDVKEGDFVVAIVEKNVLKSQEEKLLNSSSDAPEMEHKGDDSVGAEAGSHLDAHDDDDVDDDERRAFVTGNDVIIQELNSVVEKLEKEKSELKASLEESLVAKTTFESALEEIGRQRESDAADWRCEAHELGERIEELEKEKNRLVADNSLLRSVSKGSSSARVLAESDRRIEELGQDFEEQLAKVHRHNEVKTNQLFKEFNTKMAEAEASHQRAAIESKKEADVREQKMIAEHNEEMEELQNEIYKFDTNMEEIKDDYEIRLREMRIDQERTQKSMESLNKTFEKEVEKRVVVEVGVRQSERENALREELVTLADKWDSEGELKGDVLCPESLAALDRLRHEIENDDDEAKEADVDAMRRLELTREIEELRERQKVEVDELIQEISSNKPSNLSLPTHQRCTSEDSPSEADKERRRRRPQQSNSLDASSSAAFPVLLQRLGDGLNRDQQLRYLKGTVIQQLNQVLKLRCSEAELRQRIDSMAHEESVTRLSPLFREPTEMEYLKQVIYQYMTGKEVSTMTKVIAAIMKFTPGETRAVVDRTEGMITKMLW